MKWTNYHSHTRYSDGTGEPVEYVREAIKQGIVAYGFSCHAPVDFPCSWTIAKENASMYFAEIDRLREEFASQIEIYKSLEIDYFPGNPLALPENYSKLEMDYIIGSVHFVDNLKNGEAWNIDTSKRIFDDGMLEIFNGDGRAAVTRFYDLTMEMIAVMKPTIVGHIDKIKMFNINSKYFSEHEQWYKDKVEEVLTVVKRAGCIIEVNTRGIYRSKVVDHYPSDSILRHCFELGIPVTINSDCHRPEEVVKGFEEAATLLHTIGYKSVRVLLGNKWQDVGLSPEGLEI